MRNSKRPSGRGYGMIVLLIVLVIVAFMVARNWTSFQQAPVGAGTDMAGQKPQTIIDNFKKEADKMGQVPPIPEMPKMDEN